MINIVADLHVHTLASSHALSSLGEMLGMARKLGYRAMAVTDHGPALPDAPHPWYFHNLLFLPGIIEGDFLLLKGVEANVTDEDGTLDLPAERLEELDWVICSMHRSCLAPLGYEAATALWLKIADNPLVNMIGHAEQEAFFFDYDKVTRAFAEKNKVVEMNAASRMARPGNEGKLRLLAESCKKNACKIAVNSDAHSVYWMDVLGPTLEMLDDIGFPEEFVVNSSMERLHSELRLHHRAASAHAEGLL